jgi:hypothetical protein
LWSNSGTARIGFQLVCEWQFSQGIARGPCGLRVCESGARRFCPKLVPWTKTTSKRASDSTIRLSMSDQCYGPGFRRWIQTFVCWEAPVQSIKRTEVQQLSLRAVTVQRLNLSLVPKCLNGQGITKAPNHFLVGCVETSLPWQSAHFVGVGL